MSYRFTRRPLQTEDRLSFMIHVRVCQRFGAIGISKSRLAMRLFAQVLYRYAVAGLDEYPSIPAGKNLIDQRALGIPAGTVPPSVTAALITQNIQGNFTGKKKPQL
jgi:hypothetical protein